MYTEKGLLTVNLLLKQSFKMLGRADMRLRKICHTKFIDLYAQLKEIHDFF